MASETPPLFGKTRFLAGLIEEFLDKISEGVFMVEAGFRAYLSNTDDQEICEEKLQQVIEIKRSCSDLRRRIVTMLYTEMLLPDARGDVLRLLGNLFELLDEMGDDYQEMMIVQPRGLSGFAEDFAELNAMAMRCVQAVVLAARTFSVTRRPFVITSTKCGCSRMRPTGLPCASSGRPLLPISVSSSAPRCGKPRPCSMAWLIGPRTSVTTSRSTRSNVRSERELPEWP